MEYRILGPVEVREGDVSFPVGGPRERRSLVALLLNADRVVSVDRLVEVLWGDEPPRTARTQIRNTMTALRRNLSQGSDGASPITRSGAGFVIQVGESELDVLMFARRVRQGRQLIEHGQLAEAASELHAALRLWRGPALGGLGAPVLDTEARGLDEQRLSCLEQRIEVDLDLGRHRDLAGELATLVEEHPLRERLAELQVLALYAAGRRQDALAAVAAARSRLAEDAGLDPGPELVRLQQMILRGEPSPRMHGDVSWSSVGTPRQLPAAPSDFTGRDKELRALRAVITDAIESPSPGSSAVVGLFGMAGVGKTTLATRVAHDLAEHFPGGCLYADLHGTDDPEPAMHILGRFLRALGVGAEAVPSTAEERAALYRTLLAERKALVLLDNVADEEQVRPLLPGAGGAVLLTSRRPLAGLPGASLVHVDVLERQQALDLLAAIVGKDRVAREVDAAQHVAALCGWLPLAVRVAAVRLATQNNLRFGALGERLADERERLDELALGNVDVRASLAVSSRQLSPEQVLLWQALCVLPVEEIGAWPVAAMLDIPIPQAQRRLEQLTAAQLLAAGEGERHRLHDLIRLLGKEQAEQSDMDRVAALVLRACRRLLDLVRTANAQLPCRAIPVPAPQGAPARIDDPLEFLGVELTNIMAIVRYALDRGETELAAELAASMVNFLMLRGHTDQWEQSHRLVLQHSARLGPATLARVELSMATLQRFRDRNREALPHLRRAWRLMREVADVRGEASAALSWGVAARMLGHVGFGRSAAAHAMALLRQLPGDPGDIVELGYALAVQHHLDPDPEDLRRALAVFEPHGEAWGAAEVHALLASWHSSRDELQVAAAHAGQAMDAYGRLGDRVNYTVAQLILANTHIGRGAFDEARPLLNRALRTGRDTRHPWCQATAHRLLGLLMLGKDDAAQALPHLDAAVDLMRAYGQQHYLALALEGKAKAHARLGDNDLARGCGQEAYEILARTQPQSAQALQRFLSTLDGA